MPEPDYATKQDLLDLRLELKQDMGQMQDHLIEAMRDMQTEVLRAFHNWASPMHVRVGGMKSG
jgi:hypothetical protein